MLKRNRAQDGTEWTQVWKMTWREVIERAYRLAGFQDGVPENIMKLEAETIRIGIGRILIEVGDVEAEGGCRTWRA